MKVPKAQQNTSMCNRTNINPSQVENQRHQLQSIEKHSKVQIINFDSASITNLCELNKAKMKKVKEELKSKRSQAITQKIQPKPV